MANEWKSMDTVPMDGRYIDVFHPSYGVIKNVFYGSYLNYYERTWKIYTGVHGSVCSFESVYGKFNELKEEMLWEKMLWKESEKSPIPLNISSSFTFVSSDKLGNLYYLVDKFLVIDDHLMFRETETLFLKEWNDPNGKYKPFEGEIERLKSNFEYFINSFGENVSKYGGLKFEKIILNYRFPTETIIEVSEIKHFDIRENGMTIVKNNGMGNCEISYKIGTHFQFSRYLVETSERKIST